MAEVLEAIQGALLLVVAGFFFLVFGQAVAESNLDTGPINLDLMGILAILGGILIVVTVIALLVSQLLEGR